MPTDNLSYSVALKRKIASQVFNTTNPKSVLSGGGATSQLVNLIATVTNGAVKDIRAEKKLDAVVVNVPDTGGGGNLPAYNGIAPAYVRNIQGENGETLESANYVNALHVDNITVTKVVDGWELTYSGQVYRLTGNDVNGHSIFQGVDDENVNIVLEIVIHGSEPYGMNIISTEGTNLIVGETFAHQP